MRYSKLKVVLIAMVSLLALVVAFATLLLTTRVIGSYTIKAGEEISAEVFRRYDWDKGMYIWTEKPDASTVGTKTGKIQVFPFTYQVTLEVTEQSNTNPAPTEVATQPQPTTPVVQGDVTAPVVTTQKVTVYAEDSNSLSPQQFIQTIEEESEYSVEFFPQPDLSVYGTRTIRLMVKDSEGNFTEAEAELCILNINKMVSIELGKELPEAKEFLYADGSSVSYVSDISGISTMAEGNYEVHLLVDGVEAVSTLQIKDTTAPVLALTKAEAWLNKPIEPTAFIDFGLSTDNSDAFEAVYTVTPDWSKEGEQEVTITATDASGNSVTATTKLLIKKDTKAPVVTVTDIDVKVGGTVSYKKAVSYYDDIDSKDEMKLSIERNGVDLKTVGTYKVIYTVTDCSGNSTSVTGKINVLAESPKWEDEEAIHAKAKEILDKIIKEGMTEREKAKAIYTWVKSNIGYISHSEKGNYIRGAYEGLFKKEGDCFIYAATAKELLTLAEIPNIDIVKSTTNPSHYWNLVYIEDGWYHFDTTPRKDKSEFFLLTDAELEAYSSAHKNTHIFDRSLYPKIK